MPIVGILANTEEVENVQQLLINEVGFNENCFIELRSLKVDELMEKVGHYHLVIMTRKKTK